MALVNQTLAGFYGGVSQQAPELRHDTQVSEMINCYPTIIGGTAKRPPSTIAYNDDTFPTDSFVYAYDRGAGNEQYIICINNNSQYRVFDVITQAWINLWTTKTYLALPVGAVARDSFSLSTVGDTTFVVNKTKNTAMSSTVDDNGDSDWETTFYYWVKRTNGDNDETDTGNASLRYNYYIYQNGVTPAVGNAINSDSTLAASNLATDIGGTSNGSVVKKIASGGDIWSGADSWGNQASESWQGTIKKLADLPTDFGFEGAVIEISGDDTTNFDNYYVKYEGGVYKETFKPGQRNSYDATTMPHKLELRKQTGGGYVNNFDTIDWDPRKVGDDLSASEPSFIGQPIQDVFFYRNRLGFISGDNVILSESGSYYNFFPTTVTDVIDSDPIDVAVDSNKAISLRYASPFNKELLIFGDKAQFIMSAGDSLTPKNVSVQQSTAFDIKDIEPVVIGPNAYFATETNNYSGIREYFVQPDSLSNDAANITAHCPNYIPKNLVKLVGSSKNDMLFALSADDNSTVYVYNFYWQGEEKAQSAWHKWTFNGEVFNIEVLGNNLLLMIDRYGTVNLETIPLEFDIDFTGTSYMDALSVDYTSTIVLTKPGFAAGNVKVADNRGDFVLKSMKLQANYSSFYNVKIDRYSKARSYYFNAGIGNYPNNVPLTSKEYNYITSAGQYPNIDLYPTTTLLPGSATYAMSSDHKYPIAGNTNNLEITITNDISSGFRINSLDLYGTYIKKSKNVG